MGTQAVVSGVRQTTRSLPDPYAPIVCCLKLLVYAALSYYLHVNKAVILERYAPRVAFAR